MTKTELTEKVGKKFFLADEYTLAAKLKYESGIPSFEKYLNGKTLKQIGAVIHLTKYPKGLVIKIAKLFSSFPFGMAFSEINRILLSEKPEASKLIFETSDDGKIIFSLKTSDSFDVRQFLEEIHVSYDNGETKNSGSYQKNKQKTKENSESHSKKKQEEKGNEQQNNRQSFNDGNNRMSKDKAFEILGVKLHSSKEEIKNSYRTLVKKYNSDQRGSYEEHVRQMLDDKMKEINAAKDFLQKSGFI